ncbi:hypothetical protein HY632_00190 [Candidatus Uhrbacteria bacterium]|nr:hypothetical protein [Candidatus Uhrbacteria bacterium]
MQRHVTWTLFIGAAALVIGAYAVAQSNDAAKTGNAARREALREQLGKCSEIAALHALMPYKQPCERSIHACDDLGMENDPEETPPRRYVWSEVDPLIPAHLRTTEDIATAIETWAKQDSARVRRIQWTCGLPAAGHLWLRSAQCIRQHAQTMASARINAVRWAPTPQTDPTLADISERLTQLNTKLLEITATQVRALTTDNIVLHCKVDALATVLAAAEQEHDQ